MENQTPLNDMQNGEAKARYTFTYARENGGDWMIK
jgi:hypothetical protein